ncbi:hypothetical protein PoB_001523600 [Plakobranchus ocellatus]|uniref:Uncharacterized protein n=1 Tax=Plakobranchus ocellatus TaxID=259542 RepID=A0AAV3YNB1_9GAST|nr:hypothetical protein PoB_001523600 [Plakobranchus ocellatus]
MCRSRNVACYREGGQHTAGLRLLGHLSGQGLGGRARTCYRRIPADLRADSLSTLPPSPYSSGNIATCSTENEKTLLPNRNVLDKVEKPNLFIALRQNT